MNENIGQAASSILKWASDSSNMDGIDFDVTVRWNGKTSKVNYEYPEDEDEILIRCNHRWGRLEAKDLPKEVFFPAPYLDVDPDDVSKYDPTASAQTLDPLDNDAAWLDYLEDMGAEGIMMADGKFYPMYGSSDAESAYAALKDGLNLDSFEAVVFFGSISSGTESGEQLAIIADDQDVLQIINVAGWTLLESPES